jgi:hypothetical protein
MEDVLLDTDGGSGLSRASSSFGHVAHPPSSRVPGGGFRRVEVVGVRTVFSGEGSPSDSGRKKHLETTSGEVQLRKTERGLRSVGGQLRRASLEGEEVVDGDDLAVDRDDSHGGNAGNAASNSPLLVKNGLGTGLGEGLGGANSGVEVYEDLLRGSDEDPVSSSGEISGGGLEEGLSSGEKRETAGSPFPKGPFQQATEADPSQRDLFEKSANGTTAKYRGSESLQGAVVNSLSSKTSFEMAEEGTLTPKRVLIAEGSTAASVAAAVAQQRQTNRANAAPLDEQSGSSGLLSLAEGLSKISRKDKSGQIEHPPGTYAISGREPGYSGDKHAATGVEPLSPSNTSLATISPNPSNLPKNASTPQQSGIVASLSHAAHALHSNLSKPKPFTVYILQTVTRDGRVWVAERRYRDLASLRTQLGRALPGVALPLPFSLVFAQKRNVFGSTATGVVNERKELFEQCLNSLIDSGPPLATAPPLIKFLCGPPEKVGLTLTSDLSPESNPLSQPNEDRARVLSPRISSPSTPGSPKGFEGLGVLDEEPRTSEEGAGALGNSIRLIVDIPAKRSVSRQLQVSTSSTRGFARSAYLETFHACWTLCAILCVCSGRKKF